MEAIDCLEERISIPLAGAAVKTEEIDYEIEEMVAYATQYISPSQCWNTTHQGGGSLMFQVTY